MRLLLNENISRTVIQSLRQRGHDVLSAKKGAVKDDKQLPLPSSE
jgi:hypothetical protein